MNALSPQANFDDAKKSVEEQLDLPGIVKADPAEASEQPDTTKGAADFNPDFLKLEELLEQIKVKKPELPETEIQNIRTLYESIDNRTGGKLAIPRTAEGAALDNADLALELYGTTKLGERNSSFLRRPETVFGRHESESGGVIKVRDGGVVFHGKGGVLSGLFGNKSFTQEDARQIALLAMHNKDLLPPNAVKITGTKEQRLMIKAEIDKLNELLPEKTRFTLTAKQANELATAAPAANATEIAPEVSTAVNDARLAALASASKDAPAYEDTDVKFELAKSMSDVLSEDRANVLANSKPIGQLAKFGHDAYETIFHDAHSDTTAFVQIADLGEERGLKVIRIEPNENYPGYQSTPYVVLDRTDGVPLSADLTGETIAKTPLAGNFDAAGNGKPLTQSHPDFIGPRDFVGPRQPSAAPTPNAP